MRKYSSNLAFVDLLFNLLVGFTSLFIIAFLLINPIAKKGTIDPPIVMMVEMRWDDSSYRDMDLYVRDPSGSVVYYANKENGYVTLKRDDLGNRNDSFIVNGEKVTIKRNYEVTTMTVLPDGDYVINVHQFSSRSHEPVEVEVVVTGLQPYAVYYTGTVTIAPRQEATMIVFKVVDGKVTDIRTDVEVKLRKSLRAGGTP